MNLVHDLLDKPVVDRNGREMGRVDGIVVDVREEGPPRVTAIEIGPAVLAHRINPTAGRWAAALEHACGVDQGRPLRIPFGEILSIAGHVTVDRAVGETSAATIERAIRAVIRAIPGSS